jgi:uncharacterized protein
MSSSPARPDHERPFRRDEEPADHAQQGAEADAGQRAWLAKRNRCTAVQCLRQQYFNRIAELARELPSE